MSRDEAGRAGTTNAMNVREQSKLLRFSKAPRHLENRYVLRGVVGSNPTPSAVKRAFPPSPIASAASQYHNAYHNQRRTTIRNLDARDAWASRRRQRDRREAARGHRCGGGWPGWAQHAPRPLATPVDRRVAAWGTTRWGEWVERFADTGGRARSRPTHTPAKVPKCECPNRRKGACS